MQSSKLSWITKTQNSECWWRSLLQNKNADFLLNNGIYNYFSIGILVDNAQSCEAATYFLENLGDFAPFLWNQNDFNSYLNFYFSNYYFMCITVIMKQTNSLSWGYF